MGASWSSPDCSDERAANSVARFLAASVAETPAGTSQDEVPAVTPERDESGSFTSAVQSTAEKANKYWWWGFDRSELPNPGGYEEMGQDSAMILRANLIEGLSFNMSMPASQHLAVGPSFDLGAKDRPGVFAATANYFSNDLVCMTRMTPADGRINGRIFYNHTPKLTSKFNGDVGLDIMSSKGSYDLDYRGEDFCSTAKIANGGIYAVSYLQSVTPWLALGGEGFYQSKSGFSAVTVAGKYAHGNDTATISVASFGPIIASFVHRLNPRVAFASELFVDGRTRDSHISAGYRFDLRTSSITGLIDSSGRVAATVEEKINPGLSLILSGELDHQREDYKFGFGVNIGGN